MKLTEGFTRRIKLKQSLRHGQPRQFACNFSSICTREAKIVATSVEVGQLPQVADHSTSLQTQRVKCPKGASALDILRWFRASFDDFQLNPPKCKIIQKLFILA